MSCVIGDDVIPWEYIWTNAQRSLLPLVVLSCIPTNLYDPDRKMYVSKDDCEGQGPSYGADGTYLASCSMLCTALDSAPETVSKPPNLRISFVRSPLLQVTVQLPTSFDSHS